MSAGLPFVHFDSNNQKLFRISRGVTIKTPRNSKKAIAKQIYIVEEIINRVWTVILICEINEENPEESRRELVQHVCQVYKATNPSEEKKQTLSAIDQINSEIDEFAEQLENLIKDQEGPSLKEVEGEIRRKGAKKDA